jgi:hypothetical protein
MRATPSDEANAAHPPTGAQSEIVIIQSQP